MEKSSETQHLKATKQQWTVGEDAALMDYLLQLVENSHWKVDARSSRPRYAKQLEKYLHEKIPNCTLKASPHIKSRVQH